METVGEEVCVGKVMVERRARKWKHSEYVVLFEAYQESIVEGMKGWQVRMLDGWVRRGMWIEERKVLVEKLRVAKTTLAKVEKEVIKRKVRQMGGNGVNVERMEEEPTEDVVREKRMEEAEDDGGPEVRVVVERLDVWRDGDEVKQLDNTMKGVLARLR